jgi:hypothetical protein
MSNSVSQSDRERARRLQLYPGWLMALSSSCDCVVSLASGVWRLTSARFLSTTSVCATQLQLIEAQMKPRVDLKQQVSLITRSNFARFWEKITRHARLNLALMKPASVPTHSL